MTVQPLPWSIQGQSHPAEVARSVMAAMLGAPAAAFVNSVGASTSGGSHGVVAPGDFAVSQNGTPNMSVNVAAGRAFIRSGNAASLVSGVYGVLNDATVNVGISAADATNPRIDLIVVQVRDANYGEAASDVRLTVVAGTPAASPAVPSLALFPNALVLAEVRVNATVTTITNANITDRRTRAAALGGVQVCTSTTRPTGVALYEGLKIVETDTDRVMVYDGAAWQVVTPYGAWTFFTPTFTGVTIGNGTRSGWFTTVGNICFFRTLFTFGSTSAVTGAVSVDLPLVAAANQSAAQINGSAFDTSAGFRYPLHCGDITTTSAGLSALSAAGTYAVTNALAAAVPITWAVGDEIRAAGFFGIL